MGEAKRRRQAPAAEPTGTVSVPERSQQKLQELFLLAAGAQRAAQAANQAAAEAASLYEDALRNTAAALGLDPDRPVRFDRATGTLSVTVVPTVQGPKPAPPVATNGEDGTAPAPKSDESPASA